MAILSFISFFVETAQLTKNDEILKTYPITYEGHKGYLILSTKKLVFLHEKGLFSKHYDTLLDVSYKKIEGVKATDTQHLELTYGGKTHHLTSSGLVSAPLVERSLNEVIY